ncbi:S-layer homology domain-containing protein [Paenibacillus sp. 32352]|uniref:S-layer homology domain-containing protein n=1 Tax=Paenibacillus sp. 32352 TaxID=1969111 RepID=UPI0009ADD284|nr:S-layer homology domain-containing protein [Paenibacillus sp. 32352]
MKKKMMAAVIAGASLLSVMGGISAAPQFSDVNGHWGKDQIEFALAEGYVDGYPDGTFRPEQNVTRAEFMKLVIDALKFKKQDGPGKDWYAPYVTSAVANGIHLADEFPADHMNDPITREEMARIAVRATGEANYDVKKWMYLATSKGIINGMDDAGTLGPEQPTTRAQAITVIRRIMKIREGASLPKDKYAISAAEVYWHKTNVITMLPQYFSHAYVKGYSSFRDDLLRYDGPNGFAEVEKYIVIDLDDLNDPNRGLIPTNFKWRANYKSQLDFRSDIPRNSYALLSFNHIIVDLDAAQPFTFTKLQISPFYNDGSVDESGNLRDITLYSAYDEKYNTLMTGLVRLEKGNTDLRFVTGQLLPKGKFEKQYPYISIYRIAAKDLGENIDNEIYLSKIDYNLNLE